MTYSRLHNNITVRRKLLILRKLTNSKSVKQSAIIMDAFLYIYKLKLRLETLRREYVRLTQQIQNVKVEKLQNRNAFLVRVACKKGPNTLVSILEALEEMGLCVINSRVTCNYFFGMEAIVEPQEHQQEAMEVREVTQALHNAIHANQCL